MDDLQFNFLSNRSQGSSLFRLASFKHSRESQQRLAADTGQIPLEYIVEELEEEMAQHAAAQTTSAPQVHQQQQQQQQHNVRPVVRRDTPKKNRRPKSGGRKRDREYDSEQEEELEEEDEELEDEDEDEPRAGRAAGGGGKGGGGKQHVDITEYLCLPQSDAAVKLGLPVSTLSKRWKEAAKNRKWPFRKVSKLDKEIAAVLQTVPQSGVEAGVLPPEVEQQLTSMLRERANDLRKISIRL